ncbi:hypothetical protein [Methylobacterium platani]|uniref:Uncharacterized protein n=2 Tax=Methylobacterium platani TaxID=427683 RepID=A0A179SFD9_9HYPH|nr:hypothetical protein [Methylobacterium platani]KMO11517.1 hypothetical protein SQ03_27040 [Methylobacterium platani JCM 14648]OAS26305.1 hypothetical protein A5481_06210 [Methylobacterium platani]
MLTFTFATTYRRNSSVEAKRFPDHLLYATPVSLDPDRLTEKARRLITVCDTSITNPTDDLAPEFGIARRYPSIDEAVTLFGGGVYAEAAERLRQIYSDEVSLSKCETEATYGPRLYEGDDPHEVLNQFAEMPGLCARSRKVSAWTEFGNGTVEPTDDQARRVWGYMLHAAMPRRRA